jgi:hypothetical protein
MFLAAGSLTYLPTSPPSGEGGNAPASSKKNAIPVTRAFASKARCFAKAAAEAAKFELALSLAAGRTSASPKEDLCA